jgi:Magnesium transporter MRS2-like
VCFSPIAGLYRLKRELDEDLAAMYLSDKQANKIRALNDHEDLEVLLESFAKQVEEIVNEAETIAVSIALFFGCGTAVANVLFPLRATCNRRKRL